MTDQPGPPDKAPEPVPEPVPEPAPEQRLGAVRGLFAGERQDVAIGESEQLLRAR